MSPTVTERAIVTNLSVGFSISLHTQTSDLIQFSYTLNQMGSRGYGTSSSVIYRWFIDPLLAPLRPRVVRLCLTQNLDNVLDIGSATGAQCRALDAAGIRAVGLDLSPAMIASASARPGSHVEYIVGSAFELPFPAASFAGVLLSLALHEHAEQDRMKMIREALRVLRPDGHLIVVEYSRPRRSYIHIPWLIITLIEHLAGSEHRTGFRQFMATGGLRGLLQRHNLEATEMTYSHFHSLAVASIPIRRCP